jgi:cytochrome c
MKKTKSLAMLLAAMAATAGSAHASEALAAKYACVACHQADKKTVGPSWKDIAAKYAGTQTSTATLAASTKRGSSGKWGPIPMPAQPALSDADAQALATWMLGQAPAKP